MNDPCILLIDDHAMFRTGLRMVIAMAIPGAMVFEAESIEKALSTVSSQVHIALLDIKLQGASGLEAIPLVRRQWPLAPVLMLSSQDEPETARLALSKGAAAFVSKAETAEAIVEIIGQLLRGEFAAAQAAPLDIQQRLTARQFEVLELLHQGCSNKLIARKLTISDNTVRRHVQDVLQYFQVASRAEAVVAARRIGLVG